MVTFALAVRLTAFPALPWKPLFPGWISLLWLHVFVKVSFWQDPGEAKTLEERMTDVDLAFRERQKKVLDPVKRKTLQPGHKPLPDGYREATPDEVKKLLPPVEPSLGHIEDPHKKKSLHPATLEVERKEFEAAHETAGVVHKFFGSQLILGNQLIISNLAKSFHHLEITPKGQVFIDNNPYVLNPSDVATIKAEILKARA